MGLDMYFYKKTYVKNWKNGDDTDKHIISVKKNGVDVNYIKPERIAYIVEEVAYYRKFNALHNWIITNCADNNPDEREILLNYEDILQLYETLLKVGELLNKAKTTTTPQGDILFECDDAILELFSPTEGFFFGSAEIDEYYKECVEECTKFIKEMIDEMDYGDFNLEYYASW